MLSSIPWKPMPTTTTQTSASPFGAPPDAGAALSCPPKLTPFPAPGPHPCDASCKKSPPDASQNLDPHTQLIEKEWLKTPRIIISHPHQMRHPDGARGGGRTALQPLFSPWQAPGFDRHGSEHPRSPKREVDMTKDRLKRLKEIGQGAARATG